MDFPFEEKQLCDKVYIRVFDQDVDEGELVWHRDYEDRIIEPMHDTDWMFQVDNELPKTITERVSVPMGVYHRLIKGTGKLSLRITKIPIKNKRL